MEPRRQRRPLRRVSGISAAVLAVMSVACRPRERAFSVDLLAADNRPRLLVETTELEGADPAFGGGFYPAEPMAGGRWRRWAGAGPAHVELSLTTRRARRIEIEMRAFHWPGAAPLEVEASLAGVELANFGLPRGWTTIRLEADGVVELPGRYPLELRPSWTAVTSEVLPDAGSDRELSFAVRRLRVEPRLELPPPVLDRRGLRLPPGSAASWCFWVPDAARLEARFAGPPEAPGAGFTLILDGEPARPLERLDLAARAGRPARLLLANPLAAADDLVLERLGLEAAERPAAGRPTADPSRRPPPGKAALVVGRLARGFPVVPCSTDPARALRCLLSGQETAAFGNTVPDALDFAAGDAERVASFLISARAPATAALIAPEASAEASAEALRARLPGLRMVLAGLPGGPDDLRLRARVEGARTAPVNARDLDLAPTVLGLAGARPPADLAGVDLGAALAGDAAPEVRPVAFVWDPDRTVAWSGDAPLVVPHASPPAPRSVLEDCQLRLLERRRRQLAYQPIVWR